MAISCLLVKNNTSTAHQCTKHLLVLISRFFWRLLGANWALLTLPRRGGRTMDELCAGTVSPEMLTLKSISKVFKRCLKRVEVVQGRAQRVMQCVRAVCGWYCLPCR